MLKSLIIKNYALIDDVNIHFNEGFTSITGETGAGKSILLGALSLLLGKRADYGVIQDKSKKCIVEGQFDLSKLQIADFFVQNDLDFELITLIRREIIPSGRSRAFINDTPVNLELLKEIGDLLVDIHSQHETLEIGKSVFQIKVLDDFLDEPELINQFKNEFKKYVDLKETYWKLQNEHDQLKRDEGYLKFQFEELQNANLVENEDDTLVSREKLLIHAEDVMLGISNSNNLLSNGDNNVLEELTKVHQLLLRIEKYYPEIEGLAKRIESSRIELEDISHEIGKLDVDIDFDPGELTRISERLNEIYKLQQKHHVNNVSELIKLRAEYDEKLNNIDLSDERLIQLKTELNSAERKTKQLALQLHEKRTRKAPGLAGAVKKVLAKLGMKEAGFEVSIKKTDQLNQDGIDQVKFLFNANEGGQLKEIFSIASGGELSRLMLAIKSQITKQQLLPTVIFDEIDSGVSGDIAGKVGNIIREMSDHHQIIAITHLPQIASKADEHFRVYKFVEKGKTKTNIQLLNETARVEEIAKLLSDENISGAAMDTARELLRYNLHTSDKPRKAN